MGEDTAVAEIRVLGPLVVRAGDDGPVDAGGGIPAAAPGPVDSPGTSRCLR